MKRRFSLITFKNLTTSFCPRGRCDFYDLLLETLSFIDQRDVIRKILEHVGLWEEADASPDRGPPEKEITFDPSYGSINSPS